jgi:hypothetical protein
MAFLYELATRLVWELKSYGRLEPKFSSIQTLGTIIYPAIRVNQRVQSAVTVLCRLHYLDLNHSQSQSQPRTSLAVMEVSEVQRTGSQFYFRYINNQFSTNFQLSTIYYGSSLLVLPDNALLLVEPWYSSARTQLMGQLRYSRTKVSTACHHAPREDVGLATLLRRPETHAPSRTTRISLPLVL